MKKKLPRKQAEIEVECTCTCKCKECQIERWSRKNTEEARESLKKSIPWLFKEDKEES